MWTSEELKIRAKGAFHKNYWHCVLTALVMGIFSGTASIEIRETLEELWRYQQYISMSFSGMMDLFWDSLTYLARIGGIAGITGILFVLVKIFLGNVLFVGGCRFFVINQTMNPMAAELGYGMRSGTYGRIVLTMFLKNLYTSLWSLLFVIPGIIKRYEYLMIPYILAENPEMNHHEAFLISKQMMMGQKLNAFALDLTFIGWALVALFTGGIAGVFYVQPYYQATFAELYTVNRTVAYQSGYIR